MYDKSQLEIILNEKERLALTLHKAIIELDEKIDSKWYKNTKISLENNYQTPCRRMERSFVNYHSNDLIESYEDYQASNYCKKTKSRWKGYLEKIVPSPIELK